MTVLVGWLGVKYHGHCSERIASKGKSVCRVIRVVLRLSIIFSSSLHVYQHPSSAFPCHGLAESWCVPAYFECCRWCKTSSDVVQSLGSNSPRSVLWDAFSNTSRHLVEHNIFPDVKRHVQYTMERMQQSTLTELRGSTKHFFFKQPMFRGFL